MQRTLRIGPGGLPVLLIEAPDGARAELHLQGAHLTSWMPAGATEDRLFVSARTRYAPAAAIRGGVPVCFPQFSDQGPLHAHGFARNLAWQVVDDAPQAAGTARLRLADSPATHAIWPHRFRLELDVAVSGRRLTLALTVTNAGAAPFDFTAALHTYLAVREIGAVAIHGLHGARYRDKVTGEPDAVESADAIAIRGEIDRVYFAAPEPLIVTEPGRALAIHATGFGDTVVWNPGPARAAALADMEQGGHLRMLCIEAAASRAPVAVAPGAAWRGSQTLVAD